MVINPDQYSSGAVTVDIANAAKSFSRLTDNTMDYIRQIFGDSSGELPFDLPQNKAAKLMPRMASNLLNGFYVNALDSGLLKNREFIDEENRKNTAGGVAMLNRSAFINQISRDLDQKQSGDISKTSFLLLDIGNLRAADLARDWANNSAADLILNSVAAAVQNEISKLNNTYKDKGVAFYACRYGGDEFSIGVVGDQAGINISEINEQIGSRIKTINGYYREPDHKTAPGKVQLKNDAGEIIEPPKDKFGLSIFEFYFKKGLILNHDQIEAVKSEFHQKDSEFQDYTKIHKWRNIYPEPAESYTLDEKIDIICRAHSELRLPFYLAQHLDTIGKTGGQDKTESLLRFVENVVYDRLLNADIHTLADFKDHLMREDHQEMWVFDLKFIKEINDSINYVKGDQEIEALWKRINQLIDPGDRGKFSYVRRGGTFILALKDGVSLNDTTVKLLKNWQDNREGQTLETAINGNNIVFPVGFSHIVLDRTDQSMSDDDKAKWVDRQLNTVLGQADKDVYIKIIRQARQIYEANPNLFSSSANKPGSLDDFIARFFMGKRSYERADKAANLLRYEKEISGTEYKDLVVKLQEIADQAKK